MRSNNGQGSEPAANVEGASCLSVPVSDRLSRLLGALFITAALERLENERFSEHKALFFEMARQLHANLSRNMPGRARRSAVRA